MIKGKVVFQCEKDVLIQRLDLGTYSVFPIPKDALQVGDLVWMRDEYDDPRIQDVQNIQAEFARYNKYLRK
jgi:hypothetical protein